MSSLAGSASCSVGERSSVEVEIDALSSATRLFERTEFHGVSDSESELLISPAWTTALTDRLGFQFTTRNRFPFILGNTPHSLSNDSLPNAQSIYVRAFQNGRFGPWRAAKTKFFDGQLGVAKIDLATPAKRFQFGLQPETDMAYIRVSSHRRTHDRKEPEELERLQLPLRQDLINLGVRPRDSWNARAARCGTEDTLKSRITIHHTATPTADPPESRLRAMQAYHQDVLQWCDIGYHFMISLDGVIWAGRPVDDLGAHVEGNNLENIGIALMGCFQIEGCSDWTPNIPSKPMLDAAVGLIRHLSEHYAFEVTIETLLGHRDVASSSTACPGAHLYARLDEIRERSKSATLSPPKVNLSHVVDQRLDAGRRSFIAVREEPSSAFGTGDDEIDAHSIPQNGGRTASFEPTYPDGLSSSDAGAVGGAKTSSCSVTTRAPFSLIAFIIAAISGATGRRYRWRIPEQVQNKRTAIRRRATTALCCSSACSYACLAHPPSDQPRTRFHRLSVLERSGNRATGRVHPPEPGD